MKIMKFDVEHFANHGIHWFNVKSTTGLWRVLGVRVGAHDDEVVLVDGGGLFIVDNEPDVLEVLKQRLGDRPC